MLAVGRESEAEVWQIGEPTPILIASSPAQKIAFGPNDLLAIAGPQPIPPKKSLDLSVPYVLELWDVRKRSLAGSYFGTGYYVFSVAIDDAGSTLVWGRGKCSVREFCSTIRRFEKNGSILDRPGPAMSPTGGTFCPDPRLLAAGAGDGHIVLWDVESQKPIFEGTTDKSFIEDVSCSRDQQRLVSGEMRGRIAIWDRKQSTPIRILEGFANEIAGFASGPDSRILLFMGRGTNYHYGYTETLLKWDVNSLKAPQYLAGSSTPIAESENGAWTAVGKDQKHVVLLHEKDPIIDTGVTSGGARVAFDPKGEQVALTQDGAITVWNTLPWAQRAHVDRWTNSPLEAVSFSRDGKILASAGGEGAVTLWDLPSMHKRCVLGDVTDRTRTTWSVAFSPDGSSIAPAGNDQIVKLWELNSCKLIDGLKGHEGPIHQIAYSADGKFIASAGWDGTARLWDVGTKSLKYVFRGHGWLVDTVAFLQRGQILLTGGEDGAARLWEVASGKELATVVTFRDGVDWLVATPEGYFDSTADAAEKIFGESAEPTISSRSVAFILTSITLDC